MSKFLDQQNILTAATAVIILLFSYPSWVGLVAAMNGTLESGEGAGSEFFHLLFEPTSVWDAVRGGLAILIAAVAAAELSVRTVTLRAGIVMIALVLCMAPATFLFLYMTPVRAGNLWGQVNQTMLTDPIESTAAFSRVWNSYLIGQFQILGGNFLLFLGVSRKT